MRKRHFYLVGGLLLLAVAILVIYISSIFVVLDYRFDVYGKDVNEAGVPLPNVKVSLAVSVPVYEVINPISTATTVTEHDGSFRFGYISHESNPVYHVKLEAPGYLPIVVKHGDQRQNPHHVVMMPDGIGGTGKR